MVHFMRHPQLGSTYGLHATSVDVIILLYSIVFNASYIQHDLDWRPGRTVILCSWDAEEYGLIGSYEWTEVRADSTNTHQLCSIITHD